MAETENQPPQAVRGKASDWRGKLGKLIPASSAVPTASAVPMSLTAFEVAHADKLAAIKGANNNPNDWADFLYPLKEDQRRIGLLLATQQMDTSSRQRSLLNIWLEHIRLTDSVHDKRDLFNTLKQFRVSREFAQFYIKYAEFEFALGNVSEARNIVTKGAAALKDKGEVVVLSKWGTDTLPPPSSTEVSPLSAGSSPTVIDGTIMNAAASGISPYGHSHQAAGHPTSAYAPRTSVTSSTVSSVSSASSSCSTSSSTGAPSTGPRSPLSVRKLQATHPLRQLGGPTPSARSDPYNGESSAERRALAAQSAGAHMASTRQSSAMETPSAARRMADPAPQAAQASHTPFRSALAESPSPVLSMQQPVPMQAPQQPRAQWAEANEYQPVAREPQPVVREQQPVVAAASSASAAAPPATSAAPPRRLVTVTRAPSTAAVAPKPAPVPEPKPVIQSRGTASETEELVAINGRAFRKLGVIGKGGSSKVFKVMGEDGKLYALKRVRLENTEADEMSSYVNEINLLESLQHCDSIIKLYGACVDTERQAIYLLMQLGEVDLAKLLQGKERRLGENFIRLRWQEMLEAVQAIHNERIVHADLKPANFLMVQGQLKLIDFGIARNIRNDTTNIVRESQMGTVNYMSPEALMDTSGGARGGQQCLKLGRPSDIWSLGCILYQMVFGLTPFAHVTNMMQKLHAITNPNYQIQFPDTVQTSRALLDVIQACLHRNPLKRPTIAQLLEHDFLHPDRAMKEMMPAEDVGQFVQQFLARGGQVQDIEAALAEFMQQRR